VLSVTRHRVGAEQAESFEARARAALDVLRVRPGFLGGSAGPSTDDPGLWVVVTSWQDVGSFRRALSALDVKLTAVPLLATAMDEASAFERLLTATPDEVTTRGSDRAEDADRAGPWRG
jgi:quinol monooxygenase YgiN